MKGAKLVTARLDGVDPRSLRTTVDQLKGKLGSGVVVLAAVDGDKVQLAAGVTPDLTAHVKAGELVAYVAGQVGGKGGGKPDFAMAGGHQPAAVAGALESVRTWVEGRLP